MALMMGALYETLSKVGATPEDARRAAEEIAGYEGRINGLEVKIDRLDAKLDKVEARLEAKIDALGKMMVWMVGVAVALNFLTLGVAVRGVLR